MISFLKTIFFIDLINGARLTFKKTFQDIITIHYPDNEKWVPFEMFRGLHYQAVDENNDLKCVACELCARICPSNVITIEAEEDENGCRRPRIYTMDLHRCAYCGLCVEVCPEDAIKHGSGYEFAGYKREDAVMTLEKLLKNEPNETDPDKMGTVVKARLVKKDGGITVEKLSDKGYRWW